MTFCKILFLGQEWKKGMGGGEEKKKNKENRRKVTTNFDVSFMTYRKTSMRQTIILALASTKFCNRACQP